MKVKVEEHIQKHIRFYKAALMALVPLVVCAVTCAVQGYAIWDAYIPASEWNDELFYYKQVEGMVKYGYPYGYFGFNESHARVLSFAAWSPVWTADSSAQLHQSLGKIPGTTGVKSG